MRCAILEDRNDWRNAVPTLTMCTKVCQCVCWWRGMQPVMCQKNCSVKDREGKASGTSTTCWHQTRTFVSRASNILQPWMWNCVYCARNVEQNFWLWFCVQFLIRYKTQSIVICNNLNKSLCPLTARCSCRKQSLNVNFVEINV